MLKRIAFSLVLLFSLVLVQASALGQNRRAPDSQTHSPHGTLAIPCENCHTQTSWKPIRAVPEFNHNTTSYPLRGMHVKVDCIQCHTKPVFSNVSTQCSDCHADIHRRQFGANCEQCHSVIGWNVSLQAVRAHENRFPLIGAHAAVDCIACHKSGASGQFAGLSTECYSCHVRDFQNASRPNHVADGFSTNCQACHGVNTWFQANFNHNATGFPLTGAHVTVPCASCHVNNNFNLTNTGCIACHQTDYRGTTNPSHAAAGFPTDCTVCHSTASWTGATFNHASTGFALTGAHVSVACTSCHVGNNYSLASTACVTCHQADYNSAITPVNHIQLGFPTNCEVCHNTVAWSQGAFNHNNTPFPLTGAHVSVPCASCHVNNNYTTLPTLCSGCHITDYNKTANPNHGAAGWPTTCDTCHTTAAWMPANLPAQYHTFFNLKHGNANGVCATCHTNSSNYAVFQCTGCHGNNNAANFHHPNVGGYVYNSINCYSCHP
jgi:hypothetical protein